MRVNTDVTRELWAKLSAPLPPNVIAWRQDGKPKQGRDGKWMARFVAYVEAGVVRERLDTVCPGDWSLAIEALPPVMADHNGEVNTTPFAFKTSLNVCGVVRQDVGVGKDYKQAATDSFKRAAVRFGIGHELYDMPILWVPMDGDGKYAKPLEDPAALYVRKFGRLPAPAAAVTVQAPSVVSPGTVGAPTIVVHSGASPQCPTCKGPMEDYRGKSTNPRAPLFKCLDQRCGGRIWPKDTDRAGVVDGVDDDIPF